MPCSSCVEATLAALWLASRYLVLQVNIPLSCIYPLVCMRGKGYCNRSVCLLVSLCTSHFSLISGYITQYFTQLGFERHWIDANRNGFSMCSLLLGNPNLRGPYLTTQVVGVIKR